jgi:pyruvate,water dikinase
MAKAMFVWLGSGRARKQGVSQKGQLMDRAARAGLPVPAGAILLDPFYRLAIAENMARVEQERVTIVDPELLHNTLRYSVRLPRFDHPITVSPLFDEDEWYDSPLNGNETDFGNARDLARVLAQVWTAYHKNKPVARYDVLLMEKVEPNQSGVVISRDDDEFDSMILDGSPVNELDQRIPKGIDLPRLQRFQLPKSNRLPFERRLQMLLGGVRRTFGAGDWRIDWADDGHICWLLMVSAAQK